MPFNTDKHLSVITMYRKLWPCQFLTLFYKYIYHIIIHTKYKNKLKIRNVIVWKPKCDKVMKRMTDEKAHSPLPVKCMA